MAAISFGVRISSFVRHERSNRCMVVLSTNTVSWTERRASLRCLLFFGITHHRESSALLSMMCIAQRTTAQGVRECLPRLVSPGLELGRGYSLIIDQLYANVQ